MIELLLVQLPTSIPVEINIGAPSQREEDDTDPEEAPTAAFACVNLVCTTEFVHASSMLEAIAPLLTGDCSVDAEAETLSCAVVQE